LQQVHAGVTRTLPEAVYVYSLVVGVDRQPAGAPARLL